MLSPVPNILADLEVRPSEIGGVLLATLPRFADDRGDLCVIDRPEWTKTRPVQWNLVRNEQFVMRGIHAHRNHTDWLVIVAGRLFVGLYDLRHASSTSGNSEVILLEPTTGSVNAVFIPEGVAHGFYSPEAGRHLYATNETWSETDEFGCRWDDPALGIEWPMPSTSEPLLSARDATAGTLEVLLSIGW